MLSLAVVDSVSLCSWLGSDFSLGTSQSGGCEPPRSSLERISAPSRAWNGSMPVQSHGFSIMICPPSLHDSPLVVPRWEYHVEDRSIPCLHDAISSTPYCQSLAFRPSSWCGLSVSGRSVAGCSILSMPIAFHTKLPSPPGTAACNPCS